jgi:hypothetical protein
LNTKTYGNDDLEYIGYTGSYINRREVTLYLRVSPGKYLVIPSTYEVIQLKKPFEIIYPFLNSRIKMDIFSCESSLKPIIPSLEYRLPLRRQ